MSGAALADSHKKMKKDTMKKMKQPQAFIG